MGIKNDTEQALDLIDCLHNYLDGLSVEPEANFPCALYYIAMQHCDGVLILLLHDRAAPAFALARIVYETFMRAVWYTCVATESEKACCHQDKFPKLQKVVSALKCNPISNPLTRLYDNISFLNSFTHSGSQQVFNHINDKALESSFSDEDKKNLIDLALRYAFASAFQMAHLLNQPEIIAKISSKVTIKYG